MKMAIQGPSGSGKTYSSLLVAHGLTNDWSKIAVIDTENGSAHLYADLGDYHVMTLKAPYSPERYIEAIKAAVNQGYQCLIIDSLSHEWSGTGGVLEIHSSIPGNSFAAWAKVTPRHNACVQEILQSDIHVIATMRSKTDYVMSDKNGKTVPEKVGLKATQREDAEYEFTLVFELNHLNNASVSKDRTGLFKNAHDIKLSQATGERINQWCSAESVLASLNMDSIDNHSLDDKINECGNMEELMKLYYDNKEQQHSHKDLFIKRKREIEQQQPFISNGKHL